MKKTVSVSIGGFAFILEDEAHRKLEQYLDKVRLNLSTTADGDEILSDVEGRLAELFTEALHTAGRQVIDAGMVDKATAIMGAPEEFNVTGEPVQDQAAPEMEDRSLHRSLYRDTEDRFLGGVCAGLAHYLGWDPLAVRLIFVALVLGFGTGVIVYIIMWILVPPAETTAEKLRMQGQPVNLDSIKGRFRQFGEEVKEWGNDLKKNKGKFKKKANSLGKRFEDSVFEIGRVFARVVGVMLLLMGGVLCFFLFAQLANPHFVGGGDNHLFTMVLDQPSLVFEQRSHFAFLYWGIITLVMLFIISLIRSGIRLLFRIPLRNKLLNGASVVVSVLAVASVIYGGIRLGRVFSKEESVTVVNRFETAPDTLYLQVDRDVEFSERILADEANYEELVKLEGRRLVFGNPQFDIRRSDSPTPRLEVERTAHGAGRIEALRHAENIFYPVQVSRDSMLLQPFYSTPLDDQFRAQQVRARLFVPTGTVIMLSEGSYRILRLETSETNERFWQGAPHSAKAFVMERDGLRAL